MIPLEYIIAQCQDGNVSVAINSKRPRNQNPALHILKQSSNFYWILDGLHIGDVENITGEPRVNRLDFYIGMDDLVVFQNSFPSTSATSLGLVDGLRVPVGKERVGGKTIKWRGPLSRVEVLDTKIVVPPFKLKLVEMPIIFNIDKERSPYPIDNGNGQTMRELHFGIEHPFILQQNLRVRIPRAEIKMNARQYATVLEAINTAILIHQRTP
jgi:hypothetical protein